MAQPASAVQAAPLFRHRDDAAGRLGRMIRRVITLVVLATLATTATAEAWWQPPAKPSWYWQLTGTIRMDRAASIYDVDGTDTTASTVAALHAKGRRVVAYFSAGSYENWRPDASAFPAVVKGRSLDGWAGERWLDVRRVDILIPIMRHRAQLAASKGFDAVEWDNVDGYQNATGFSLTASDQLAYNRALAATAHDAGLAVLQKNDPDQATQLQPSFDGALVEECARYHECGALGAYLAAGKPVLQAEYGTVRTQWATDARAAGRMLAFYSLSLDGHRWLPQW
jgi:hypothetical protein